jgi:hypothetical protein
MTKCSAHTEALPADDWNRKFLVSFLSSKTPRGSNFASADSAGIIPFRTISVPCKLTGFSAKFSFEPVVISLQI